MKKLLLVTTITALTMTSIISAPKAQAADIAQSVCEYVAADDKKRMRSFLKSNKLKIRNIFSGIQCNGKNLLEFAATKVQLKQVLWWLVNYQRKPFQLTWHLFKMDRNH